MNLNRNFVEAADIQKVNISGFELTKSVFKSKKLTKYIIEHFKSASNVKMVLANLCTFYNYEKNCIFPKVSDIELETCLSVRTIGRILADLHKEGLILRQEGLSKDKRRNFYVFTGKFWDLVQDSGADKEKILRKKARGGRGWSEVARSNRRATPFNADEKKYPTRCHINNQNRRHGVAYQKSLELNYSTTDCQNFNSLNNNILKNNNSKNYFFENSHRVKEEFKFSEIATPLSRNDGRVKTEFQKEFADVIEKLTEFEWKRYLKLEGFEKRKYLEAKRSEFLRAQRDAEMREKLEKMKIETQGASHLDLSREKALELVRNMPKQVLRVSTIAKDLIEKWNFSPVEVSK